MFNKARFSVAWVALLFCCIPAASSSAEQLTQTIGNELRSQAVQRLRDTLHTDLRWPKIHAGEALLKLDYTEGVRDVFELEASDNSDTPSYRIGIWRVLAQEANGHGRPDDWTGKICDAFSNPQSPDRINAAETLGKLSVKLDGEILKEMARFAGEDNPMAQPMATWALAANGEEKALAHLVDMLAAEEPDTRLGAAYALRYLKHPLTPEQLAKLNSAADNEPEDSKARVYLYSAAYVLNDVADAQRFRETLVEYGQNGQQEDRYEVACALAERGHSTDIPLLTTLLDDADPDVRVGAAYALLRLDRRVEHTLSGIDWVVILGYVVGMLGVGWYYSRRTKSAEDYLLGGRNMKPWAVGLSLFATLLSTLSYLFIPGEMIKYGPMILGQIAVYPLIVLVVGWVLIPHFMKLKVTSAYELLEVRLGNSVRFLGALIFLNLRLLWMAMIIYATTDKVLVPLMGISPEYTPWLCVILGVITIIYTSMGGLRAVVFTDVVQTMILFGGAILALGMISYSMGGVSQWWPHQWAEHWQQPAWFNLDARISFLGTSIGVFFWWICTAGSDQMSIQRYLATKDTKSARRSFAITMLADAGVTLFLAALGFALLAYFKANPHLIPDGTTLYEGADKLFPKYIVFGLPVGITGLVIAGLLAAAMSSLSSGINSSCSVITSDFIAPFSRKTLSDADHVRLAKYMSVLVGAIVVALSFYVSAVPGNLLEKVYRVVNLLSAPLFVTFFMALFIPYSTAFGTWLAVLASAAAAITVAYWETLTGSPGISFLWITPISLATGIVVGSLASLIPFPAKQRVSE